MTSLADAAHAPPADARARPVQRILFAVGGDFLGQSLPVRIAQALPGVECRFVGQLWVDGHWVRQAGHAYRCWPWANTVAAQTSPLPNLTDFQIRGLRPDRLPESVRRAHALLSALVAQELDQFRPDAVVSLTAESVMGQLFDRLARQRGIAPIGLQTTFLRDALLVHADGAAWAQALQSAALLAVPSRSRCDTAQPHPAGPSRPHPAGALHRAGLVWAGRVERLLRALRGAPSFDTVAGMLKPLCTGQARRLGGFATLGTPDIGEQPPEGLVLVALHRPVLPADAPDWTTLLRFALAATPADVPLVVRPHPGEPPQPLPSDLLAALRERQVRVSRPGQGASLETLLAQARALLTLTSATGMQALQAGVPTVVIGPAFYARPGMAWQADPSRPAEVRTRIAQDRLPRPDPATLQAFLGWIERDLSAPLPPPTADGAPAQALATRILALAQHPGRHPTPTARPPGTTDLPGPPDSRPPT